MENAERRQLLRLAGAAAASLAALDAAVGQQQRAVRPLVVRVQPTEELMHQHGVLRRCLRAMERGVARLAAGQAFPPAVLGAARLFMELGTDHHERKLEEGYVFPDLQRAEPGGGTDFDRLTQTLVLQHRRSEDILQFLLGVAGHEKLTAADVAPLARSLRALRTMYAYHTAVEESLVFPTWKAVVGEDRYRIVQEAFEQIARKQYGRDAIEGAVKQISAIEVSLGIGDLAAVTAPPPR